MFDKDSSPVLRRGFIKSSAIGLVASGLNYSNAYNDTKKIETMANKKELLESLITCLGKSIFFSSFFLGVNNG